GRSEDGVARVALRASATATGIVVEVADAGPGVPAEQLDRLLRPFERMDAERSDSGGAGLGLAIVDRIARRYGGSLRLSSTPGSGLRARVELPGLAVPPQA